MVEEEEEERTGSSRPVRRCRFFHDPHRATGPWIRPPQRMQPQQQQQQQQKTKQPATAMMRTATEE